MTASNCCEVWSFVDYLQLSKTKWRYGSPKFCIGDYNITIWFLIYLKCKLIKSMGCHMLWILTSEEIDELVLDGIIIPHWQWKITLVLSHWLNFMNLNLELFVIHQRCCNTHCQRISIIGIILWIWYLIIFMDFYILDENFIQFLSYKYR